MVFFTSQIMPRKSGEISGGWPEKIVGGTSMWGGSKILGGANPLRKYVFSTRRGMYAADRCVYGKVWSLAEMMVAEENLYRKYGNV